MARHDHYGTHDETGRGPSRRGAARDRDIDSISRPDRAAGRHAPNYGNGAERAARTQREDDATFQARDYERENYGGGYGVQRRGRDVPAAGRKGEWMHESRKPRTWRGQAGGEGLDGLASERAFGSDRGHQMSAMDPDTSYRRWRDSQLRAHDEDYHSWRREQARRYDEDYARQKARGEKKPGHNKR